MHDAKSSKLSTRYAKFNSVFRSSVFFKEYVIFLIFLFYEFLIFGYFLTGQQRVHDSYLIEIYKNYGLLIDQLFNQGRIFSSLFYRILLFFDPPFTLAMQLSVGISLVFLALSAYIVYCMWYRFAVPSCKKDKISAAVGSLMIFFNIFVTESMLFFENAIMSMGVLFATLACFLFVRSGAKNYIGAVICIIISVFSYQPTSVFFPPLVVLFLGIKHSNQIRLLMKKFLLAIIVYGVGLAPNFIFMIFFTTGGRLVGEVQLYQNILNSNENFRNFILNNYGFMPNYLFSLFLLCFLCVFVYICIKQKLLTMLFAGFMSFAATFLTNYVIHLPIPSDGWYVFPRSGVALAGIGGLILTAVALCVKKIQKLFLVPVLMFLLIVSYVQLDTQKSNYATNCLDMQQLENIVSLIHSYENYHGITIKQILIAYDQPRQFFRDDVNSYNDLTIPIFQVDWMPKPLLQYRLGRNIPVLFMHNVLSEEQFLNIVNKRQACWFTNREMIFEDDILYLFIPGA